MPWAGPRRWEPSLILSFMEIFCGACSIGPWLLYGQMIDRWVWGGRQQSASPTASSSIIQSLEKSRSPSACLFAWNALLLVQHVRSLGLGMSVSLYTQESELLLPEARSWSCMYFLSMTLVIWFVMTKKWAYQGKNQQCSLGDRLWSNCIH